MIKNALMLGFLAVIAVAAVVLVSQKSKYTIHDQGSVVKEMRSLSRFETSVFTIDKVIDAGTSGNAIQQLLFGDKILLVAHGQVIAGFDLSNLSAQDVQIQDTKISLTLPPPQILVASLDSNATQVFDRKTGLLTKGDKDLESKARAEAETSMKAAACTSGILTQASENGKKQLTALLSAFGFKEIDITIPNGSCN